MTPAENMSYGFIEVRQYVKALAVLDQMLKSNYVELVSVEKLGSGYVTLVIKGELASVQLAAEEASSRSFPGEVTANVIAKPYPGWEKLLTGQNTSDGGSD
jgi:microcompartment protein CcmL/EutN